MTSAPPKEARGGTVTLGRGVLTFAGAVTAALAGFALSVAVGRSLGPAGAGVFFSLVAAFTIASTVLKFGLDTAQLWRLPRLLVERRNRDVAATTILAVLPAAVASVLVAVALALLAAPAGRLLAGTEAGDIRTQVLWAAAGLAFMAPLQVLLAGTRGLGAVGPFVLVQNVGVPLARLVAVVAVLALGMSGAAVMAAWSIPVAAAAVLAALLLRHQINDLEDPAGPQLRAPRRELADRLWRFAGPRGATASIEVVLVAASTLIVGLLQGPAAAGVFGALSRFVTTGTLAEQTVRVLVAPRFSALLGTGDLRAASRLYSVTTPWVVAVAWPIFLTIGAGAPALLSLFGPDFTGGATALAVLAATMCVTQLAGNVQTILLMSGRSGLQLANKSVAVLLMLALHVVLIPRYGLLGAAIAWSVASLTETGLSVVQVRGILGIRLGAPILPRIALVAVAAFLVPTFAMVRLADAGLMGLGVGLVVGAALYVPMLWWWRHELHLTALAPGASVEDIRGDP